MILGKPVQFVVDTPAPPVQPPVAMLGKSPARFGGMTLVSSAQMVWSLSGEYVGSSHPLFSTWGPQSKQRQQKKLSVNTGAITGYQRTPCTEMPL